MVTTKNNGYALIIAAAVLWGTTGTCQAFAPEGATPSVIGAVRIAIGGLTLLVFAGFRGTLRPTNPWPFPATLLASIGVAAYQPCFFEGVSRTGVAVGTIVAIGSAPVIAGLLGFALLGERPGIRWILSTISAILGCVLLSLSGNKGIIVNPLGIFFSIGAGASYAVYTLFSKRLLENHTPDAVMAVIFCLGAVLLSPFIFTGEISWLKNPRGVAVALHLGLIATAASYFLYARGLKSVRVATTATLSLAEPLTAGVLGTFLLGESFTPSSIVGAGLLTAGLVIVSTGRNNTEGKTHALSLDPQKGRSPV